MLFLDEVWGHQTEKGTVWGATKGKAVKDQNQQNAASSNKMLLHVSKKHFLVMLHSAAVPTSPFCFSSPPQFIPAYTFRRFSGWKQGSVRFKSQLGTFSVDGWSSIHSVGCDKAGLF